MIKCHISVHKFSDSLFIVVVQRFVGATGSECDKIFPPFEFPECVFYYPPPFYDVFLIQHFLSSCAANGVKISRAQRMEVENHFFCVMYK